MDNKNTTNVLIDGHVYTLSGIESEDYIQRVALYINNKLKELRDSQNAQILNSKLLNILLAINIADDLYKEKDLVSKKELDIKELKKQIEFMSEEINSFEEVKKDYEGKIEYLESKVEQYKKELDEYIEIFDKE